MATKLLELEDVHTYYGDSHVIQGLSIYVNKGEAVSILGRNGVGKTTTLRTIAGLTPLRRGTVRIGGKDTGHWPTHRIVKETHVAYVPAERNVFPGLSVKENLKIGEQPPMNGSSGSRWTLDMVYEYFPILKERHLQDGSTLSGGEQQMLVIGRALMGNPEIMLLDEPSQGLAPIVVAKVAEIVKQLCALHGLTLVVVEQNFRVSYKLAQRHYLMDLKGQIKRSLTNEEWAANEDIVKKHLSIDDGCVEKKDSECRQVPAPSEAPSGAAPGGPGAVSK
ncbi:MAG: ABC transporter ATP-binding protein [Desulfobacteraceae bacterium]|nr:ABC transporter ATP-binding protein [Desulfobacteraceae bacterium]